MDTNNKWMTAALKEAKKAMDKNEVPIGAVVVMDGKIIARGYNQKETTQLATKHAEIVAIEKANKKIGSWRLNKCELYVTVEPCPMCVGAIIQSRIKKVVYGTKDPKFGAIESMTRTFDIKGWNHYPEIEANIMKEECTEIIRNFFIKKRNKS